VDEIEDRVRDQWKIGIGQFWATKLSTAAANRPHRLHSVFIGQEKQKSAGAQEARGKCRHGFAAAGRKVDDELKRCLFSRGYRAGG
jgi:hypothetical protein